MCNANTSAACFTMLYVGAPTRSLSYTHTHALFAAAAATFPSSATVRSTQRLSSSPPPPLLPPTLHSTPISLNGLSPALSSPRLTYAAPLQHQRRTRTARRVDFSVSISSRRRSDAVSEMLAEHARIRPMIFDAGIRMRPAQGALQAQCHQGDLASGARLTRVQMERIQWSWQRFASLWLSFPRSLSFSSLSHLLPFPSVCVRISSLLSTSSIYALLHQSGCLLKEILLCTSPCVSFFRYIIYRFFAFLPLFIRPEFLGVLYARFLYPFQCMYLSVSLFKFSGN